MLKITLNNHKAISWNKLYSSKHWSYRKKLADDIHALVKTVLLEMDMIEISTHPVNITITAYYKDKRRHDPDNVCAKLYIDGLVRAGVIVDDDSKHVKSVTTKVITGKENKLCVELVKSDDVI